MDCPRCGQAGVTAEACPRCGVVFAKLAAARPRPASPSPPPPRTPSTGGGLRGLALVLAVVAGGLAGLAILRSLRPAAPAASSGPARPPIEAQAAPEPEAPPALAAEPPSATVAPVVEPTGIPATDAEAARRLVSKINRNEAIGAADIQSAEDLNARYPQEPNLLGLLEGTLVTSAVQERAKHRHPEAVVLLRRAAGLRSDAVAPRRALVQVLLEQAEWTAAEAAARELLALSPRDARALESLAYALYRQDRSREAADAYRAVLEVEDSASARAYLQRIQKNLADEKGMTQQHLSHFNVRYDGDAHEDVGREILRALERHYATLVSALDHQPQETIPVILFSRQAYYDASGAPAWSGGAFDQIDGRIRVPIMGLSSSLTPEMDETLVHELTHAFVHARARGLATRDIHEGLAQYMEGRRAGTEQLEALANGRAGGVRGFYLGALAFVEYLMASRGQGGLNDLLRLLGETGDVDEAFRQVYGQDYQATRLAWMQRLRQQHGS